MEYPIKIKGKTIKQVTKLNLSHKNLKTIPDNVYQYANLEKLDLSYNRIEVIPQEILKLKKLRTLDLAFNNLKYVSVFMFIILVYTESGIYFFISMLFFIFSLSELLKKDSAVNSWIEIIAKGLILLIYSPKASAKLEFLIFPTAKIVIFGIFEHLF